MFIRVLAYVPNLAATAGPNSIPASVIIQDTLTGSASGVSVSLYGCANVDEMKAVIHAAIVAYINANWTPPLTAGQLILIQGL